MGRELLAGWGRTAPSAADVVRPDHPDHVVTELTVGKLTGVASRGVIARGLGRSYGDAAQSAGGRVISLAGLASLSWVDERAGLVRASGGTTLGDLFSFLLPAGWTLAVAPGTRHVTVGGAIAADVHGKNHVRDGSFARYVTSLTLVTPGAVTTVTPSGDPDLFWATVGGLGLTGVVLDATLSAVPVTTAAVRVSTHRAAHLDALMVALESGANHSRYAVAWLDAQASRSACGRGIVASAEYAEVADLPASESVTPLARDARPVVSLPRWLHLWAPSTAPAIAALNAIRFRRAPEVLTTSTEPLDRFLWPLDAIDGWNHLYGRAGFVQYQFVVPFAAADVIGASLERLRTRGCPPFLAVLKCLGPADPGPLSFPMPGWTLALDFPTSLPGLAGVLDELDEVVAQAGGRVYLAKDARLRPDMVAAMYPALDRWRAVRNRVDPVGVLTSDLGRRLGLLRSAAGAG